MLNYILPIIIILQIQGSALAQNDTLYHVAQNRQNPTRTDIAHKLDPSLNLDSYECMVALPTRYHVLLGDEVYFLGDDGSVRGPWLVVDFQSPRDEATVPMEDNNLLADVNCPSMYHKKGKLFVVYQNSNLLD